MSRRLLAALAVLVLPFSVAACGDDDEGAGSGAGEEAKQPATAAFAATGTRNKVKLTGPSSVEAGLVRITFKNSAKGEHGVQLIRIAGGHTAAEALKAGEAWGDKGKPLASWITLEGGVTTTPEGKTFTAVQNLKPGKYVAFDLDTNARTEFEVTGTGSAELPAAPGSIQAVDYSFTSSGLKAGTNKVRFTNAGKEPHFAVGIKIKPGKTIADVRTFFRTEKGEEPVDERVSFSTGVLDGGRSQVADIQLRTGKYALLCFVPDRKGGPPHAFKGMISEAVVE
jgi:hypothetical protein